MRDIETRLLQKVLDAQGLSELYNEAKVAYRKEAFGNPLENSSWSTLIDGALKGLEMIALATFDWKLTAIVKLLQSWIKDKREEMAAEKEQGHGSAWGNF